MTDTTKQTMMSRGCIEWCRKHGLALIDGKASKQLDELCNTALRAHDIHDEALEKAALICDHEPTGSTSQRRHADRLSEHIRSLKEKP